MQHCNMYQDMLNFKDDVFYVRQHGLNLDLRTKHNNYTFIRVAPDGSFQILDYIEDMNPYLELANTRFFHNYYLNLSRDLSNNLYITDMISKKVFNCGKMSTKLFSFNSKIGKLFE